MSDPMNNPGRPEPDPDAAPTARVIEVDVAEPMTPLRVVPPQVIATDRTERITAPAIVPVAPRPPARRRDRVVTLGIAGVGVFFVGWLAVDAAAWVAAAFERGPVLGALAATAVAAGVAGAGAVIAREVVSLFRLKTVEAIHQKFADNHVLPARRAARPSRTCSRWFRGNARRKPRSRPFSARSSCITRPRSRSRFCRAR